MNKIIVIGIIVSILIIGVFVFFSTKKTLPSSSPNSNLIPPINTTPKIKLNTYKDSSGFSFKYPENYQVISQQPSDTITYAQVMITSSEKNDENVMIKIIESDAKSVDEWMDKQKITSMSASIKKISLADLEAKQFETSDSLTTVAKDEGALITITALFKKRKDLNFFVYKTVVESFEFINPVSQNTAPDSQEGNDDIVFEGEEEISE